MLNLKINFILLAKEKMTDGKFCRERLTNDSPNLMNICDLLSGGWGGESLGSRPQKDTNYAAEKNVSVENLPFWKKKLEETDLQKFLELQRVERYKTV